MTHLSRFLLSGTAALGLLLSGCQASSKSADKRTQALADDASKDELVSMMKDAMATAQDTNGNGSPAMWTFSDDDTTVYLYGTVHLLKPDLNWRTDALDEALKSADTLVLEADVSSPDRPSKITRTCQCNMVNLPMDSL